MASWLKVAEDLLEVVDRRAKIVATELSDEQSSPQPSGSSSQEGQAKKGKLREKGLDDDGGAEKEEKVVVDRKNDIGAEVVDTEVEVQSTERSAEDAAIVVDGAADSGNSEGAAESSAPSVPDERCEPSISNQDAEIVSAVNLEEKDSAMEVIHEKNIKEVPDTQVSGKSQDSKREGLSDSPESTENQQEHKLDSGSVKDQDQLEEARGLLKNVVKTGQSKEARLARVCAGLSSRLQEYKSENAQLEELLVQEREKCSSYEAHMKQLQQELSMSRVEGSRAESNMVDALTAKNAEIESLVKSLDSWKKKAAASEEKLAALQEDMDGLKRNRELTETRVIQALREELATVERRAEEERIAHNATKMAAVEREVELEHRAVEASNALARIQRAADQSSSRAMELEHKVAVLEVECASLQQELQEMEACNRRAQKKPSEEANQVIQMQAWQEEVERARQSQREAETKISSLEAELQKMRVEMAGMKRDAEHYSRQEHVELEKRYRELTDLLYHKQTQLESMASEKAALEFQLEKSIKQFHEVQMEAERSRVARRSASAWEEDADIKALEPLPLHHRHMATANQQLQKAAKLLDSGAVRATRFLWRHPVARVSLLFYLVFVHLFLMYLMHRLQDFASREGPTAMGGLANSDLP
ncbi:hypothetical protein OsI_03707 [Oryza sativa Indica Group]|uniref:Golgin-84 n=1 Tax=Oryza sativa subsp. indica TaxID=39946 RepID=B8A9E3_ORYSI|nr:hypothetical protein OsI_03707 [Oryza sativa Indica Group]